MADDIRLNWQCMWCGRQQVMDINDVCKEGGVKKDFCHGCGEYHVMEIGVTINKTSKVCMYIERMKDRTYTEWNFKEDD